MKGLKARKLYRYISLPFLSLPRRLIYYTCPGAPDMSLALHGAVKVVFALQVTNSPLIKFSSTHKVLTSLTPSQISEAQAVTS